MDAPLIAVLGMFTIPWTIAGLIYPRAAGMRNASRWKILGFGSLAFMLLVTAAAIASGPQSSEPQPASGIALALSALLMISFLAWPITALIMRTKDQARALGQPPRATADRPAKPVAEDKPRLLSAEQRKNLNLQEHKPRESAYQVSVGQIPVTLSVNFSSSSDDPLSDLCPEPVDQRTVSFMYENGNGEPSNRTVDVYLIGTSHFAGFCHRRSEERTFRFDRIVGMATLADSGQMVHPKKLRDMLRGYGEHELRQRRRAATKASHEILFTGFKKDRRAELEEIAHAAGMTVRKTVTTNLDFLCGGANAGPTKLAEARERGVMILNEQQFLRMLETGEVPA